MPRWLEAILSCAGLAIGLPIVGLLALGVIASDGRPALFRQTRIGKGGRPFQLIKLRTMRADRGGGEITAAGDARISAFGKLLRRLKLDELPQLWNVLRGDMSFVGPRPEVPRFVDLDDPLWKQVLSVRPGLTSELTVALRDEEALLAQMGGDPEDAYRKRLQPIKLRVEARYSRERSFRNDIAILAKTAAAVAGLTPIGRRTALERLESAAGNLPLGEIHDQS